MKHLFNILLAAALFAAAATSATAQQYGQIGSWGNGLTTTIVGGMASNVNATITATKWDEFNLSIRFKLDGAGTDAITLRWSMSPDGTATNRTTLKNGDTHGWFSIGAANGTTAVVFNTNITMHSHGYFHIDYITNGVAAQAITNLYIRAYGKPKRQG
jgi:hypothetical protein